eukprot:4943284-Heterocapsa_arctica.AAC.1
MLPDVAKRVVPRRGPEEEKEARPDEAPPGSQKCPYCAKWLPLTHRENCPRMPYGLWIRATRQRQIGKYGEGT